MYTFETDRLLPALPSDVFVAIQDPARLGRWWGPSGFTNRFHTFEFEAGGRWVFDMVGPDGTVYANNSVFQHIEPDRQVVIRHDCQPFFTLTITLQACDAGTRVLWNQVLDDAEVARAVAHIVEPANEQNLDRLTEEVAGTLR